MWTKTHVSSEWYDETKNMSGQRPGVLPNKDIIDVLFIKVCLTQRLSDWLNRSIKYGLAMVFELGFCNYDIKKVIFVIKEALDHKIMLHIVADKQLLAVFTGSSQAGNLLLIEKPAILGVIRAQLVLRVSILVYSVDDILHEFDVNILTTEGLISFDAQDRYLTLENIQDCS